VCFVRDGVNPAKAAARLNAKVQTFERGLIGVEYTLEDISHAIGLLSSEGAQLIGRVKYAHQEEYRASLINNLMLAVLAEGPRKGWSPPGGIDLLKVCSLAVFEAVSPPLCPDCHGHGWHFDKLPGPGRPPANSPPPKRLDCKRCDAWGYLRPSLYWRWRRARIGRKRFIKSWLPHYDRVIMPILDRYESDFWAGMRRCLRQAALRADVLEILKEKA
jgi:hypothetical protein